MAVGQVDGTPVAITGGSRGARVWDLLGGAARGERVRGHIGGVDAVAVGEVDGTPVAVTSGNDGVRVWDLLAGAARSEPLFHMSLFRLMLRDLRGQSFRSARAVAAGTVDGTPVAVTGHTDGTVRMWDLRARSARGTPLRGHTGEVNAVAVGEVDGTPVAVTGGADGTVRTWDLQSAAREDTVRRLSALT